MSLRIVFFGTAELACASLEALAATPGFSVVAVVTQPDKPRGRDLHVQPSAVKVVALRLGVPVLQPTKARDASFINEIRGFKPDLGVVVAYGQILPQALLDVPRHGCVNVHTSLLPRHRGAAPIQWAILSGDLETGVTIMKMDAGLDTGPILTQDRTAIGPQDNAQVLHDRLARMGAELLVRTVPRFVAGELQPVSQPEGATYARKIEKADGAIDWKQPASAIRSKIQAFTPWPGAYARVEIAGQTRVLKIWGASIKDHSAPAGTLVRNDHSELVIACGEGSLSVAEVQLEGRKRMAVREFLAGHTVTRVVVD